MLNKYSVLLAEKLSLNTKNVLNVLRLLEDGSTIPFIARYRKELSGNMDETVLNELNDGFKDLTELEKRKEFIIKSIDEQGKLTPELKDQIENSYDPLFIEDLYLPYKRSNKTRAAVAREKGLEPLAKYIYDQYHANISEYAKSFLNENVNDIEEAVSGALDIIAEWISENTDVRNSVRYEFENYGTVRAKVIKNKTEEALKYKDYFDFEEKLTKIPSHRLLAVSRAENEKFIRVNIAVNEELILNKISKLVIKRNSPVHELMQKSVEDSFKRLIEPSIENEIRSKFKHLADIEAIEVFEKNLRQLLLASPVGQKRTLAVDPGFRTGCKIVCLEANGDLIDETVIYPHPPANKQFEAQYIVESLIEKHAIEVIAVGNGTAGRETLSWIKGLKPGVSIPVYIVNEDGASIYSASKIAKEEFPDKDVTVRGAVSIGRRLMDPLAELVKIDPKSIGVGQYQYDVDQRLLREKLDKTVESAVNTVGVNLNTASEHLLAYISGLGTTIAKNIVKFRTKIGSFSSKDQLLDVPRLGQKAFQQSAGFLRIKGGSNLLDNTGIHPESYGIVNEIFNDYNISADDIRLKRFSPDKISIENYVNDKFGLPTLKDIIRELEKPGLDPRGEQKEITFDDKIKTIEDLSEGMVLTGIISNITNFGAFVNIGIKEKGLVHISELADKFVKDPNTVVALNQEVQVRVINIDIERARVQLSMKNLGNKK
ncbi:MAG: Tex family protein [Deltaproteobacteria bacterium]